MIYAVIDTNVLVSALITHNSLSATAKVVRLLFDGEFTPLYENSIIEEYQEVLHRAKFKFVPGVADALISFIKELAGLSFLHKKTFLPLSFTRAFAISVLPTPGSP